MFSKNKYTVFKMTLGLIFFSLIIVIIPILMESLKNGAIFKKLGLKHEEEESNVENYDFITITFLFFIVTLYITLCQSYQVLYLDEEIYYEPFDFCSYHAKSNFTSLNLSRYPKEDTRQTVFLWILAVSCLIHFVFEKIYDFVPQVYVFKFIFLSTPNFEDTLSYSSEFGNFESEEDLTIGQEIQENESEKCASFDESIEIIFEDNRDMK